MTELTTITIDDHVPLPDDNYDDAQRDRFFNPYLIATGQNAKHIVQQATQLILAFEDRKRARRHADKYTFEKTVEAVLSDMMSAELAQPGQTLAFPLSKRVLQDTHRYRPTAFNSKTAYVVKQMVSIGLLGIEKGGLRPEEQRHFRTIIWAGPALLDLMTSFPVEVNDFARRVTGECIILKDEKVSYWDVARYQHYDDTDQTISLRNEVEQVNDWLEHARLEVVSSDLSLPKHIDTSDTFLRRYFTRNSFHSGGRLFGGWWMSLSKQDRLRAIRINGERVIGLDYAQMAPRILYGLTGHRTNAEDLYEIEGIAPRFRDGVKKLFNAIIFATKPLTRKPKDTKHILPKDKVVSHLSDLIMKAHPCIADCFHTGMGHRTQFVESKVMMRVLLMLKDVGVVALPIHDGILVPQSAKVIAKGVMEKAVQEVAHIAVPVMEEC